MTRLNVAALTIMVIVAVAGGILIATSVSYSAGSIIVQSSKSGQFNVGLALLMIGIAGAGFVAWFTAVTGKNSIFRRRSRPWWPSPRS